MSSAELGTMMEPQRLEAISDLHQPNRSR